MNKDRAMPGNTYDRRAIRLFRSRRAVKVFPADFRHRMSGAVRALSLAVVLYFILAFPFQAHANVVDSVKNWMQLPGQVNELQNQYEQTKEQLVESQAALEEMNRKSAEAVKTFESSQQRWIAENEQLRTQNKELQQVVASLEQAEHNRQALYKRTMTIVFTAVGLIVFYFMLTRVLRVVLRSR